MKKKNSGYQLNIPEPNEKQKKFIKAKKRNTGYGGAKGGGKSWVVRVKAILLAAQYPGIKIMIVRESYKELMNNHVLEMERMVGPMAKLKEKDMMMKFVNGSIINFMYCSCDRDLKRFQGIDVDVIFFDESGNLEESWMKTIAANLRGVNNYPKRVYYTFNPGGRGHAYLKRIFIDKVYVEGEDPEEYEFIQANVRDNKALMEKDPNYIKQLEALPLKQRQALLEGRWDVYAGQFFEDFVNNPKHYKDRQHTHVIDPFDIPPGWNIYRSYDFGYSKPFSVGWWAEDYDGTLYRIMEYYGCTAEPDTGLRMTPDEQFREIASIENNHKWLKGKKIHGVADPAIWDGSRGESIEEVANKYGIYFEPGDNARIAGWMQFHYRLQFDENGYPGMYIFNNCEHFIKTIPALMHSDTNVEDLDTTQEDHIADETRYLCMMRPIAPVREIERKPPLIDPLNMYKDKIAKENNRGWQIVED